MHGNDTPCLSSLIVGLVNAGPNSTAAPTNSTLATNDANGTGRMHSFERASVGCGPHARRGQRRQQVSCLADDDNVPVAGRCGAAPCLATSSLDVSRRAHIGILLPRDGDGGKVARSDARPPASASRQLSQLAGNESGPAGSRYGTAPCLVASSMGVNLRPHIGSHVRQGSSLGKAARIDNLPLAVASRQRRDTPLSLLTVAVEAVSGARAPPLLVPPVFLPVFHALTRLRSRDPTDPSSVSLPIAAGYASFDQCVESSRVHTVKICVENIENAANILLVEG
jgi:hypothetical protein